MSSNVLSCNSREEALENLLLECRHILRMAEASAAGCLLPVGEDSIKELLATIDLEVYSLLKNEWLKFC